MTVPSSREAPISLELRGGTGSILHIVSLADFVEAYKVDTTFRVETPETIDPENANPKAPCVVTQIDGVGASSPAVARTIVQGKMMLGSGLFDDDFDKDAVLNQLHACKEQLVVCEQTADRIAQRVEGLVARIQTEGIGRDNRGHALNPVPQVQGLLADTTAFLIYAKRSVAQVTSLVATALGIKANGPRFDKLANRLATHIGANAELVEFVREQESSVKHLIDLRNKQEHPGHISTVVKDFRVLPSGAISAPVLHLSNEEPQELHEVVCNAAGYLVGLTEAVFIRLIAVRLSKRLPFFIQETPDQDMDPQCPIRYRLSIDLDAFRSESANT